MILVTTESVSGHEIEATLGLVCASAVRARDVSQDVHAALQNLVGGEIVNYTALLAAAREQALDRLADQARAKGANAVVALRFATAEIAVGAAEIVVYGTAVRVRKLAPG